MRLALVVCVVIASSHWLRAEKRIPPAHGSSLTAEIGLANFRSEHFVLHTDLPRSEAEDLLKRLEAMLKYISGYWAKPLRDPIECFVVKELKNWPDDSLDPEGRKKIEQGVGITIVDSETLNGQWVRSKAIVYCAASPAALLHEAVHAYCGQTFGRAGPVWYAEGMAEVGQYWRASDAGVNCPAIVIKYLRSAEPATVREIVDGKSVTGDSWKSYARRWALCHLLMHNPNYAPRFRDLGRAYLDGRDETFDDHFGVVASQLEFEHRFLIDHLCSGFRADLVAWDWNKAFKPLEVDRPVEANISARRGWQPTGATLVQGQSYSYLAKGRWRLRAGGDLVNSDGDKSSQGRLVAVVVKDGQFGNVFSLGQSGSFNASKSGDLYLRCAEDWGSLADNSGEVNVKLAYQIDR